MTSVNLDHHSFKPLPHGLCMICDGHETDPQHRHTAADIASLSHLALLETKDEHPTGNDRERPSDPSHATDDTAPPTATATAPTAAAADDLEVNAIDDITAVYSWGTPSRLGCCKNQFYRPNSEHKDAAVRKIKNGTSHNYTE